MAVPTIKRAAQHHELMAAIRPAPKPSSPDKKSKMRGICPRCGQIGPKPLQHLPDCPQDFPITYHTKNKTPRQRLQEALEVMCKAVVFWRDGDRTCVISDMDGGRCGGGRQWGHVLARTSSAWLKYDLGNTFAQCATHNRIHPDDPIYYDWWRAKFGRRAWERLNQTMRAFQNCDHTLSELEDMLDNLNTLYDERFYHGTDSLTELVRAGYYGEVVKVAWIEEGRI